MPLGEILYDDIDSIHSFDRDAFGRSSPRPRSNLVLRGRGSRNFPPFAAERIGRPAIYLLTFLPTRWGRKSPVRFLAFPPVSRRGAELYFDVSQSKVRP
jgi:hypothetical protein